MYLLQLSNRTSNVIAALFLSCDLFLIGSSFALASAPADEQTWKELDSNSFSEAERLKTILQPADNKIDLARAKLTIDKMIDPSIDIEANLKKIDVIVAQIRTILIDKPHPTDGEKMDAIRKYLYDPGPWNNYQAFSYDLDYPEGTNITEKLLPHYLDTRKGNCVSMPILFTIIGQRIGLDVTLSTAPMHIFMKYTDHTRGATVNIETVNGGYPSREAWMRKNLPMTDEAIKNGVYMKKLSKKESIVVMASTLMEALMAKQQYKKTIILSELLLQYYPQEAEIMVRAGACFAFLIQKDLASKYPRPRDIPAEQQGYFQYLSDSNRHWYNRAEELGWRQPTEAENQTYLKQVQQAKASLH